jgi:predicted TIM-barrel fold metal-dependent hydrolase
MLKPGKGEIMKIIDAHCHLGDILYAGGGEIIGRSGVKKIIFFDPISIWQFFLNRNFGMGNFLYKRFLPSIIRAEQARSKTATSENTLKSMENSGITAAALMPIPPYVAFSDLRAAARRNNAFIPFTGADLSDMENLEQRLGANVEAGARGLKLHSIIQKIRLNDRRMMEAVEAFEKFSLPVLFHAGISSYYGAGESQRNRPEYGSIQDARDLATAFPGVNFIAGHAGMFEAQEVIRLLGGLDNVSVDTSFQSPGMIKKLFRAFGTERVLFASDWPFGSRRAAKRAVIAACGKDNALKKKIFYENAASLMGLDC